MKLFRLLIALLCVSQNFSTSWGTLIPLLEDEKQTPSGSHLPQSAPQPDYYPMLPDDCLKEVLIFLDAKVIFRAALTSKTYAIKVRKNAEILYLNRGDRLIGESFILLSHELLFFLQG